MKKYIVLFTLISQLLLLCSCTGLKLTSEMKKSIEFYNFAVENTKSKTSGKINVVSTLNDKAINFEETISVIDFEYTVDDGDVIFERSDYVNESLSAHYICDGKTVKVKQSDSADYVDKTEENKTFLTSETNPLITLSLFRVDNNGKINNDALNDVKQYEEGEYTVIEFVLSDKAVSTVLGYSKADGVVRESAGHTRKYYIDLNNCVSKIQIDAVQKIISNGTTGDYITSMTVEIS